MEKDLIDSYGKFIGVTIGNSMLPIIESGVNSVRLIEIPETVLLKRLDIVLFKSDDENVVLSRIIYKFKDNLYLCGDNEYKLKKIKRSDVIAICIGIENRDIYTDVSSFKFKWYSFWKVLARPFRWIVDKVKK